MKNWPRWYSFPVEQGKKWSRRPAGRHRLFRFPCGSVQQLEMDCTAGQHKKKSLLCCWSEAEMARRGGSRLRGCTPSDEPSWNHKRRFQCDPSDRNLKCRLRRSTGRWILVSASLCWAGSIKGCTAGQVEKLRWDAELRGPCKICRADFV